ncbi:CAP-Gly domain-containing linker protein 2-like isoform X1 [Takifugu rubripes]|uniref:CAP-Gly domain containing linker protein 2 n=1 Tax=Takifugu rubripes TaxID=31033 RepID=A0A3B5KB12_TAKRU|nr:CAP-Gly domain-containing linker protein 2-like isoform X1 [Takifugu rubripes]|eukprot:XP_011609529.1 PREDICTED: CAP-Gly domain-containing linker protein 2 isoform X1 [Takifugu rubripes]
MLKSSGLKIPGRGPKHSSPMGRTSAGGTSSPVVPKDSCPLKPTTPTKLSEEGDDILGDYAVGEQVWVNGVKPGVIAYLGETQFAPGQWAGVILNDLVGKNDGSVGGVRYFECQPLQGIFTRPSKLTRQPIGEGSDSQSTESLSVQNQAQQGGGGGVPPGQRVVVPLREGLLNSAVKTGNESGSNMSDSGSVKKGGDKDLRVGDRVLVGGSKMGVIRYIGETDFAKGEWCGVELDEPLGKNDGAVAGTRYFQCLPKFGLFAPVHKVIRIGFPSTSPAKAKKSKRMAMGVSSLAHSPSSSSISSVSSVASSVSGRPSRAGLLTETSSRYARKISGTTALQEALKEKQQHIEQLLVERDLERAEMAKATSRIVEVEKDLSVLKTQHVQYVAENENNLLQVRGVLASAQKDKQELANQLEEEKRKVEDLQFRVEEESITKGDLEGRGSNEAGSVRWGQRTKQTTVEEQSRIIQLEEELGLRKAEIQKLQARLGGADAQSESVRREPMKESGELGEQRETALASQREVEALKVTVESKNQEISDMKLKIQQVSKENMEMMDMWKGKFETLVSDHQRSMEELKVTLNSSPTTPAGQEPDAQELKATLEALKMEHQLEMENLKAKHKIEAALLTKEREDLSTRLQELKEQLADPNQARRSEPEARSGNQALEEVSEKLQKAERRAAEAEQVEAELRQKLELSEKKMVDYGSLQKAQRESQEEIQKLEEKLRVTANQLQAVQADRYSSQDANVIEDNEVSEEKMKLKQSVEETMEKLQKREKEVSALTSQVEGLKSQLAVLEGKVRSGEKKAEALAKEKVRMEAELESMTRKSHDASGQLVHISQELLKKERSLNELRVLVMESKRHSRELEKDLARDVHKAEWKMKEQKLEDDIKTLREKLLLLDRERSSPDHRRYSMLEPSALDSEMSRLRQRLLSTEDALRNALEHNQQVDQLVQAMRRHPEKSPVRGANSANGIHHQETDGPREVGAALM